MDRVSRLLPPSRAPVGNRADDNRGIVGQLRFNVRVAPREHRVPDDSPWAWCATLLCVPTAPDLEITDDEVNVLRAGLREWGGPASLTEALAGAIGFENVDDFFVQSRRIEACLTQGASMSSVDWRRTLLATELVFASDVIGAGTDWETSTGICDADALRRLRSLQRKIVR